MSPIVVSSKIFLQKLWRLKIDLDELFVKYIKNPYKIQSPWSPKIPSRTRISILYHPATSVFSFASEIVYGDIAHLRIIIKK